MNRTTALVAVPLLAGTMTLTACGGNSGQTQVTTSPSVTAAAPAGTTAAAASPTSTCPTDGNTRAFAKTRFVADVGLAAGTFHRWIYTPYKEGKFAQGADGRTTAIVKAAAVAALDAKLISNAYENVKASPALCNAIGEPLKKLNESINSMASGIKSGDLTTIANTEALLSGVMGSAQKQGLKIDETTDTSVAN